MITTAATIPPVGLEAASGKVGRTNDESIYNKKELYLHHM